MSTAMKTTTISIAAFTFWSLSVTGLFAQKIDPRCAKMKDPMGCTCALENGGYIRPDGRWASARGTNNARPTNQAFTQCMMKRGRR